MKTKQETEGKGHLWILGVGLGVLVLAGFAWANRHRLYTRGLRTAVAGQRHAFMSGPRYVHADLDLRIGYDEIDSLGESKLLIAYDATDLMTMGKESWVRSIPLDGRLSAVDGAPDGRFFATATLSTWGEVKLSLLEVPTSPRFPSIETIRPEHPRLGVPLGPYAARRIAPEALEHIDEPPVEETVIYSGKDLAMVYTVILDPERRYLLAFDVAGQAVQFDLTLPLPTTPRPMLDDVPKASLRRMLRGGLKELRSGGRAVILNEQRQEGCIVTFDGDRVVGLDMDNDGLFECLEEWTRAELNDRFAYGKWSSFVRAASD